MAEIGGMLAAAALKLAARQIAEAAGDRIMLQWRFGDDLEAMKETMESIQAMLQDAEGKSMRDKTVQLWLDRLTRASYDIADMFDEFQVNNTRKSASGKFKVLYPCVTLACDVRMASKMKKLRENLDSISNERRKYNFAISSSSNDQQVINERATSPEVIEAKIMGRDQEKKKILDLLFNTSSDLIVLPIYGIGGIGKTTLAQLIFNDTHFKDYDKAWVYVSETFDLNKIKETVRLQLKQKRGQLVDTQEQDAISSPKSILIVLDDLWEKDDFKLDDLKDSLKIVGNGHRVHVIVTTRDGGIAQKIQTIEAHNIQALSVDVCWDIIKQRASFVHKTDKERLEIVGKEIAKKCGGVALAARAIGYILRSKSDYHGWVSVKDSGIWNVSSSGFSAYDNVLASLKLSYSSMLPHLRLCFAYCAIFPKGHKITKDELYLQWAALGFIKPSGGVSIQQHGENCIDQLLEMSFFQYSKSPSYDDEKDVTLFTMHDLVHDLARWIMRDEVLDANEKFNTAGTNCRYAHLPDCSKPLNSYITYPNKVRALRFVGSSESHCSAGFSAAKYLRVLDLGECSLKKLPSSIGQLKLLGYLNAPRIQNEIIPSCITKLSKLIYLSLRGSSAVTALPQSIGEIKSLIHLDISGCEGIKKLPESFAKLENLVHLDLSYCSQVSGIPEALRSLTKLQYLNLAQRQFSGKESELRGMSEVIRTLTELRYLNVSGWMHMEMLSKDFDDILDSISTVSNLEHLDLSSNRCFETLPDGFCSLRKLHTLNLTDCYLCRLPENMGRMDSLKFLIVNDCWSLDMSTMPNNKSLIPLPVFVVYGSEDEQSSNLVLLKDVNPPILVIRRLESVKSVEEVRKIELREKHSLEELTLTWTIGTKGVVGDMELLRELVPPGSLKNFIMQGYNSVGFPEWLNGIAIHLPNLVRVTLAELSHCSSLPALGQLQNLKYLHLEHMPGITKIDRGFCGHSTNAFPQLEHLTISDMENLIEWSTTYSSDDESVVNEFMFPNLYSLQISRCPKLRVGPCPPRVKKSWWISYSDDVLLRWEEGVPNTVCSSTSPATLCLHSCMAPMHQWKLLPLLPALNELVMDECNDLSSSPEITGALASLRSLVLRNVQRIQQVPEWIGHLSSLQSLVLGCCSGIQALPGWLGDLVSLRELEVSYCTSIVSFPESIGQLTNLERLSIHGCSDALRKWCELEENKTYIGHVKEILLD